jgi:hypothetical protein
MKPYKITIFICAMILTSVLTAGAVEVKSTIKGSFRNIYPNAVVVKTELLWDAHQADNEFIAEMSKDRTTKIKSYEKYALTFCNGKSDYAIIDNFEVKNTANNGLLIMSTEANVTCFNLL